MADLGASLLTIPEATDTTRGVQKALQLSDLMNQNEMQTLQLGEAKQAETEKEAQRQILKGVDFTNDKSFMQGMQKLSQAGYGDLVPQLMTQRTKMQTGQIQQQKAKSDLQISKNQIMDNTLDQAATAANAVLQTGADIKDPAQRYAQQRAAFIPQAQAFLQQLPKDEPWAQQIQQHLAAFVQKLQAGQVTPQQFQQELNNEIQNSNKGRALLAQHSAQLLAQRKETTEESALTERERHDTATEKAAAQKASQSQLDQQQLDAEVDAIGQYRSPPPSAGNRSVQAQKLLADVQQKYPHYDYTNWQQKSKAVQAFSTGQQGNVVRSLNVGVQHLNVLDQLATALANKDTQAINKLANVFSEQTGNPKVTNFNLAKQIVATEVIKGTAGSVGALADRDAVVQQIKASESPAQLAGAIKIAKRLMAGQLKGLEQQYSQATGLSNFSDRLAPETVTELEVDATPEAAQTAATKTTAAPAAAPPKAPPTVGTVEQGYKFLGGNPADPKSWQQVR